MTLSIPLPFPFWWLLIKKVARVDVNMSLAFLHSPPLTFRLWYSRTCAEKGR